MPEPKPRRELAHALFSDPSLAEEFMATYGRESGMLAGGSLESFGDPEETLAFAMGADTGLEAIVERFGRPSLVVVGESFQIPESDEWKARLLDARQAINSAIARVGRVDIKFHVLPYAGTGWMVAPDVAVTNRHVAKAFAIRRNGVFPFATGLHGFTYEAYVDFAADPDRHESIPVKVVEVIYISDDGDAHPDLAFLRLEAVDGQTLPAPLPLSSRTSIEVEPFLVTVGYPAQDSRQDPEDQQRIFGGQYNVKRVAPGRVTGGGQAVVFTHDCTTLGGNSGSVVLDPVEGEAVGLHFAGRREVANYAVSARVVKDYLRRFVEGDGTAPPPPPPLAAEPATGDLADRAGYDPEFLGDGFSVPPPSADSDDVLPVEGDDASQLRYTHYSVVMHRDRRLALYSCVNIDGALSHRIKRESDSWSLDPRIASDAQTGNELYADNPLDRGHLVRRLDPAWGETVDEALLGIEDSFFYTNSAPQHLSLNRSTWLSLEDYLLDNAATHGFRACVFTGPVFADDDPEYRGAQLPQAFWKVAVMVREPEDGDPSSLSATGYLLSQADLVSDLEFVFGPFRTFQVPIARISELTSLEFDESIMDSDPFSVIESAPAYVEIDGPADLLL